MRQVHHSLRRGILALIDFFYPLFRKFMPLQTFRYAACGGSNTLLSLFIYWFTINFIVHKQNLDLGLLTLKPHKAGLFFAFLVTFPIGFYLAMYVVFQGSYLKRRVQFFRYFLVVLGSITINYFLLTLFVEKFHWWDTPSQILATLVVLTFSYLSQRHFSFRNEAIHKRSADRRTHT